MTEFFDRIAVILLFIFIPILGRSVPANPTPIDYIQPDGTVIKIRICGDENFHYVTSVDGQILTLDTSGKYVVNDKVDLSSLLEETDKKIKRKGRPSLIRSTDSGDKRYRFSSCAFPSIGSPHSVVVLVNYKDLKFRVEDPLDYFDDFLNGDNFKRNGGTGSCRQYFINNSGGLFSPVYDVYGPIELKHERSYYGENINGGQDAHAEEMVVEAVEALDDLVDFSQYDHNGDGYVDSIYIIYADKGENDGGAPSSVWPHSWELEEAGIDCYADGVKINAYGCSNEVKSDGSIEGIGTFIHEFGHVLGLPDLYNTGKSASTDTTIPGPWSVMSSGNYNNKSRTPCNMSSFERYSLGWLNPLEIESGGFYNLPNLADSGKAFIMTTVEDEDEFFMLECRQQTGWDAYLPGHGMVVWHIAFSQTAWDLNIVNNNPLQHFVEFVRADYRAPTYSYNDSGDVFPGTTNNTRLGYDTYPALRSWVSKPLAVNSISAIQEGSNGIVVFLADMTEDFSSVKEVKKDYAGGVYDITGRLIKNNVPENLNELSPGLYIIEGKKILVGK